MFKCISKLVPAFGTALISAAAFGGAACATAPSYSPDASGLPEWARVITPPTRRGLIIGIGVYANADQLPTPPYDAQMIASALKVADKDFKVEVAEAADFDRMSLIKKVKAFAATVQPGDVVFVYFSGHGMETGGDDFIVPADAKRATPGHEGFVYLGVRYIIDQIQQQDPGITVIVLDACRVDPFAGIKDVGPRISTPPDYAPVLFVPAAYQELTPTLPLPPVAPPMTAGFSNLPAPTGFMIAFAAAAGKPSYGLFTTDVNPKVGSIFTRSLAYQIETRKEPLSQVFSRTATQVSGWTLGAQVPYVGADRAGQVVLKDNRLLDENEDEQWADAVLQSGSEPISNLRLFISSYPAGLHTKTARDRIAWLQAQADTPPTTLAPVTSSTPGDDVVLAGALKFPNAAQSVAGLVLATHGVNVRAAPWERVSRTIAVLPAGAGAHLLDAEVRPGWAKVMLQDGKIGYVGSTFPQKRADALTQMIPGNDFSGVAQLPETWLAAAQRAGAVIQVAVGPVTGVPEWQARELATLRAFRARAALVAQHIDPSRVILVVNSAAVPANETRIAVTERAS